MGRKKRKNKEISLCCGAKVRFNMSPDFLGDNPKTMQIGTCYYICTKCGEACNIYTPRRRTWKRNPATKIKKDSRTTIKEKELKKEIKNYE